MHSKGKGHGVVTKFQIHIKVIEIIMSLLASVKIVEQVAKMDKELQLIRFKHGPSGKEPINKKLHLSAEQHVRVVSSVIEFVNIRQSEIEYIQYGNEISIVDITGFCYMCDSV